jgi:hypothetical protein
MPLNEIENHPYLNYFIDNHNGIQNVPWEKYTRMIIGSFPIYKITDTVHPVIENRSQNNNIDFPFFYGSETNAFWKRYTAVFDEIDPFLMDGQQLRLHCAKSALEDNNTLLTDVIKKTNRHFQNDPLSPSDSALMNLQANNEVQNQFELNNELLDWLVKSENLKSIYFTSQKAIEGKSPGGWFHKLLLNNNIELRIIDEYNNFIQYEMINRERKFKRVVNLFFLPTPSAKRSIALTANNQHLMFVNYLNSLVPELLEILRNQNFKQDPIQKEQIKTHRENFIQLWWRRYLLDQDVFFNGVI